MYYKTQVKQRWRHTAVAVFYALILLAEMGEFFVLYRTNPTSVNHPGVEKESHLEIPEHLPEETERRYFRTKRVCFVKSENVAESLKTVIIENKCIEIATPV